MIQLVSIFENRCIFVLETIKRQDIGGNQDQILKILYLQNMSSFDKSNKSNSNSFIQLLKATYAEYKHSYEADRSIFQSVPILNNKQKRSEKTRSKSRKKSSGRLRLIASGIKRSKRLNTVRGQVEEFVELEKEPLWHPQKRNPKKKGIKQKIKRQPQIKQTKIQSNKIKSTHPLYQFYSEPAQNSLNKQLIFPDTNQSKPQRYPPPQLPQPITNESPLDQQQLQEWYPTKQQNSMLSIQNLIDEYIIFKNTMRSSTSQIRFVELAKYVRQIKGYYFNIDVMSEMIEINPKLYKLVNINGEKYVKCGHLTMESVERRQISTRCKMQKREIKDR